MLSQDYKNLLLQLLPPGLAYSAESGSRQMMLVDALAEELARIDARGQQIIEEADPSTSTELYEEWLQLAAIPDSCSALASSVEDYRKQLLQKLASITDQAPATYEALADSLGYDARVVEFDMFVAGSACGDPLYDEFWQNAFSVVIVGGANQAQSGIARAGDRLRTFEAGFLYCLLQKAKPAQAIAFVGFE